MKMYIIPVTEQVALDSEMIMLQMPVVSGETQDPPLKPLHPGTSAPGRVKAF